MNGVEKRAEDNIGQVEATKLYLERTKAAVDQKIAFFFQGKLEEARTINPFLTDVVETVGDFVSKGGKRLRPVFFITGYHAVGGKDTDRAVYASLATEMLHAAILIHDDIIDNSGLRRGKPTMHIKFTETYGRGEQFGRSMAMLAGDLLVGYSGEILGNSVAVCGERGHLVRGIFDKMCTEVAYGELADTLGGIRNLALRKLIIKTMELKSANYSVARPLQMGAVLGGGTDEQVDGLFECGRHLGFAFQMQDDTLGVFGDEVKFGKPVDSDIKEGKKTLLVLDTVESLTKGNRKADLARFAALLGNQQLSKEDFEWIKELMIETGSLNKAHGFVQEQTRLALDTLKQVSDLEPQSRGFLEGIAEYLMEREV